MVGFSYVAVLLLYEATNLLTSPRTNFISLIDRYCIKGVGMIFPKEGFQPFSNSRGVGARPRLYIIIGLFNCQNIFRGASGSDPPVHAYASELHNYIIIRMHIKMAFAVFTCV